MILKDNSQEKIGLVDVGLRLREIRSELGISIRALADKSGLNVNTVSMIENDKTSPSVSTLQKISMALEIPITTFFETRLPKTNIVFQKSTQRQHTRFTHGTMGDLSSSLERNDLEPFLVTLEPKSSSGRNMMVHTGLELVYCLEGRLIYAVEDQVYQLEPGDSIFFEAHLPHRWRNPGDTASRFLLIMLRDEESDRPMRAHFSGHN